MNIFDPMMAFLLLVVGAMLWHTLRDNDRLRKELNASEDRTRAVARDREKWRIEAGKLRAAIDRQRDGEL